MDDLVGEGVIVGISVGVSVGVSVGSPGVGVSVAGRGVSEGGGAEEVNISFMAFSIAAVADAWAASVSFTWVATSSSEEEVKSQAKITMAKTNKINSIFLFIIILLTAGCLIGFCFMGNQTTWFMEIGFVRLRPALLS